MAFDSGNVRLAPSGKVLTAPVGTVAPTDVTSAFGAGWKDLGYLDENGVGVTPNTDINDFKAWQSRVDVKTALTGLGLSLKFNLIEVTQATSGLFFFGQSWAVSLGTATMNLSSTPTLDERALAVEWTDDLNYINRLIIGRGIVTDRDELKINNTELTAFGISYKALDNNGSLAKIISNSPDFLNS